ncbi:V-type proton ATPase subunit S1 [Cephus cinctus]|uniref:V-type proton ATPase subunit S1 n=1 Tax=Cephus cinctus TaxID=211228 RepID=A0AAJ7FCV0_CEPCN|nr:V-type proton ATPase subunit S1 [Cephus cinctus]
MTVNWSGAQSAFCSSRTNHSERCIVTEIMLGSRFIVALGLLISLQIVTTLAGDTVPVLLWGGEATSSPLSAANPLLKTSPVEFEGILAEKVGGSQPPVLLFVRDNLCVEDLSHHKNAFLDLNNGGSLTYLPAVDRPLSVFENIPAYNQTSDDTPEFISDGQLVTVSITNLDTIPEIYKTVQESSPNLLIGLTGRSCSYSRSERTRREVMAQNDTYFLVTSDRVLLYSSVAPQLKVSGVETYVSLPTPTSVSNDGNSTTNSVQLNMVFDITIGNITEVTLRFLFTVETAGYYTLKTVEYEPTGMSATLLYSNTEIVFPFNFSYHCSQKTEFNSTSVRLNITNIQVQVDATSFNDAYDCVGFTTIPIWMGLFVTAIMAMILIWGLTMVMDIRTMDRFDDPKGKTITISASE